MMIYAFTQALALFFVKKLEITLLLWMPKSKYATPRRRMQKPPFPCRLVRFAKGAAMNWENIG